MGQCGQTLKHCIPPSPLFILCFLTVDSSVISLAPAPPSMPFLPAVLSSHHDGLFPSKSVKQNSSSLLKLVLVRVFCHSHENVTYKGDAISCSYFTQLFLFVFSSTELPIIPFLSSQLSSMLGIRASHAKQTLYNWATPLSSCFGKLLTWC